MRDNDDFNFWDEEEEWEDLSPSDTREIFDPANEDEYSFEGGEEFDEAVADIDFSQFKGDFKNSIGKIKHKIKAKKVAKPNKPLSKTFFVGKKGSIIGGGRKQLKKVIIPSDRQVIIQGVNDFILKNDAPEKQIGYYKGEKLKELVLCINNTSNVDFDLELFNPSMPLDYLQSTSGNLNDKLVVAGSNRVSYSDMLFNICANPTLIANARFAVTGSNVDAQKREKLTFINKALDGESTVKPLQLSLNVDVYQNQADIILFDIIGDLDRVFIPDGMDIIQYKVLANNTVTFCFYYKQKSLKKHFFKEANEKRLVLDEYKELL